MGKSEILMLLAGVALSIMLAMIAIPMFSSGSEMADRQQVQQELMSIKSSIPLIKALEGSIKAENIAKHMDGFEESTINIGTPEAPNNKGILKSKKGLASYKIDEVGDNIEVIVDVTDVNKVNFTKFSRLSEICDGGDKVDGKVQTPTPTNDGKTLTCKMSKK